MTKRILRNATLVGAMAAGAVLMAGGSAQAWGPDITSVGNNGILNGNQVVAPIQAPIDICGNAVAVVGAAGAGCQGGSDADLESGGLGDMASAGNQGIGNGNQVQAPIQVPINVCGNAVGALVGVAGAGCQGGADADLGGNNHESKTESAPVTEAGNKGGLGDMVSAGNNGILNGNQIQAPIQVPINVCGNAIAVAGVAGAGCQGGASADIGEDSHHDKHDKSWSKSANESAPVTEAGNKGGLGDMVSAGNNGIANGNQLQIPVQIPVDVSGNAIAVLGVAGAGSQGGSSADLG